MATEIGGTQAIAAGIATQAVAFTGTVVTPYQVVRVTPGWNAGGSWVVPASKIASGFTTNFAIPAPAGGSSFDWSILAPTAAASTLSSYLDCVRDILRDQNDVYWTAAQKTSYINKALTKRDRDTGQNRVLIPFVTTIGTDTYTFTNLGNTNVFDLIGINLLFNNLRYVLGSLSFTDMNRYIRQWNPPFQFAPVAYTRYGPQQFIVSPAPSIAYTLECDCAQLTPANFLVNLTDTDPLPAPYDAPVCYWAARLAKLDERAYDEAEFFEGKYQDEVGKIESNKVGMVPSLYGNGGWR